MKGALNSLHMNVGLGLKELWLKGQSFDLSQAWAP